MRPSFLPNVDPYPSPSSSPEQIHITSSCITNSCPYMLSKALTPPPTLRKPLTTIPTPTPHSYNPPHGDLLWQDSVTVYIVFTTVSCA